MIPRREFPTLPNEDTEAARQIEEGLLGEREDEDDFEDWRNDNDEGLCF